MNKPAPGLFQGLEKILNVISKKLTERLHDVYQWKQNHIVSHHGLFNKAQIFPKNAPQKLSNFHKTVWIYLGDFPCSDIRLKIHAKKVFICVQLCGQLMGQILPRRFGAFKHLFLFNVFMMEDVLSAQIVFKQSQWPITGYLFLSRFVHCVSVTTSAVLQTAQPCANRSWPSL